MKLRNKKTGEIIELLAKPSFVKRNDDYLQSEVNTFNSLAELKEEWEDYEESKHSYYLTAWGEVKEYSKEGFNINHKLEIGNYFDTREQAEKAVEKLKAFKRLKDLGFRFDGIRFRGEHNYIEWNIKAKNELTDDEIKEFCEGLHKVFGSEDESKE